MENLFKKAAKDLFYWQKGETFFTCELFSLIQKADHENKAKLAQVYPIEVLVYEDWMNAKTPEEFYRLYGIEVKKSYEQ